MSEFESTPILDQEIVNQLAFLAEDDPEFIPGLLAILKTEVERFRDHACKLFDNKEYHDLDRALHKLSGASGNVGANALQVRLRALQSDFMNLNTSEFTTAITQIDLLAKQSIVELEKYFSSNAPQA